SPASGRGGLPPASSAPCPASDLGGGVAPSKSLAAAASSWEHAASRQAETRKYVRIDTISSPNSSPWQRHASQQQAANSIAHAGQSLAAASAARMRADSSEAPPRSGADAPRTELDQERLGRTDRSDGHRPDVTGRPRRNIEPPQHLSNQNGRLNQRE